MSPPLAPLSFDVAAARRASTIAAIVTVIGFAGIAVAIGGSLVEVDHLKGEQKSLQIKIVLERDKLDALEVQIADRQSKLNKMEDEFSKLGYLLATNQVVAAKEQLTQAAKTQPQPTVGRIYFQMRSKGQEQLFQQCAAPLVGNGYKVPPAQLVPDRGPAHASVRFFHSNDVTEAKALAVQLNKCVSGPVGATLIAGYETSRLVPPRQFEVWFAP